MTELSILIPARNEMFLGNTVADILAHIEADTEVIAVCDGNWPVEPIPDDDRFSLITHFESIGQRAATNEAARYSKGKWIMKCDAHCSFAPGFDRILLEDVRPDMTIVPLMRNLHAFDWVCKNGHRRYQDKGEGPCLVCGEPTKREMVWVAKNNPQCTAYRFDRELHFQYWREYQKKQSGDLVESMSLQGSCFMLSREKYFELNICDEGHGSWGQQGTEVACKTWLSGGRVIVDKRTWYAHMFRTKGAAGFGFPYPNPGISKAREYSKDLWLNDKWEKAIHPLSWLIDKFSPVPDWKDKEI